MALDSTSFGSLIASARKLQKLSQKELAEKIIKEDGQAITPQYLNDIEHDRRSPTSDELIKQFVKVLRHPEVTDELLTSLAGVLSDADRQARAESHPEASRAGLFMPSGENWTKNSMRYVRDTLHGFGERPHYEPHELDREFERLAANFLKAKHGEVRFPFETEDLKTFIEEHVESLDQFADLSRFGVRVEGVTEFRPATASRRSPSPVLAEQ